jgi:hypothetical protein
VFVSTDKIPNELHGIVVYTHTHTCAEELDETAAAFRNKMVQILKC